LVNRITASGLFKDTIHFFTHIEKGFLFTTGSFLLKPGISSIQYLAGKRKIYQSPVSYFLIWTGLYILLHNTIVNFFNYQVTGEVLTHVDTSGQANILLRHHFTLFILPALLCTAIVIFYILAKPTFNFAELISLTLYGGGTYFMMLFCSDFILGVCLGINVLTNPVFIWQGSLSFIDNFWFSYDIFKRIHLKYFWLRLIFTAFLVAIIGWVILFYLPIVWISMAKM